MWCVCYKELVHLLNLPLWVSWGIYILLMLRRHTCVTGIEHAVHKGSSTCSKYCLELHPGLNTVEAGRLPV